MAFSIRDENRFLKIAGNQAGQAVVEYVLVLVVAVAIILGGIYQLNSAFKVWANNYFGNYLACLLETGELPTIGGTPGDSGLCEQAFKAFTLADGRPLVDGFKPGEGNTSTGGPSGGSREGAGGGSGSGTTFSGTRFRSTLGRGNKAAGSSKRGRPKGGATYTGSTQAQSYGGGYSSRGSRAGAEPQTRLDNNFAFQKKREDRQKSSRTVSRKGASEEGGRQKRITLNPNKFKKTQDAGPSSSFTISDFIRFLIIAAIIIALVMFLGGQALKIGKSMER